MIDIAELNEAVKTLHAAPDPRLPRDWWISFTPLHPYPECTGYGGWWVAGRGNQVVYWFHIGIPARWVDTDPKRVVDELMSTYDMALGVVSTYEG